MHVAQVSIYACIQACNEDSRTGICVLCFRILHLHCICCSVQKVGSIRI